MNSMRENEFEKEVQQKMDELKLTPSDAVWSKVSVTLTKQKKRRKTLVLFFIFLGFLLIATMLLPVIKAKHFFENQAGDLIKPTANNKVQNEKANTFFKKGKDEKSKTKILYPEIKKPVISTINNDKSAQQALATEPEVATSAITSSYKKIKNSKAKNLIKITAGSVEQTADIKDDSNKKVVRQFPEKDTIFSPNKITVTKAPGRVIEFIISKKIVDTIRNRSAVIKNTKNKWALGVTLAIGKSGTSNGYFTSANNRNYNYSSSPLNNTGGNISSLPSAINSGVALTVGILATHKVTSKTNIVVGVNYKLLRTSMLVGNDNTINNALAYGIGNAKTYYNNYHFIELPITFQLQVISIKKLPVFLDAGISISQLIHTNALQFDPAQGRYFIDNNLFRKTIVGLSAGLYINIANSKSAPFLLGPQFYYSATTLANKGLYANSKYSFAGIRLLKMLKKN